MLRRRPTAASPLRALHPFLSSLRASSYTPCRRRRPSSPPRLQPPPAPKKVPFTVAAHGRAWDDPYHWMRDTADPNLLDYLRSENAYADAFMADTRAIRQQLLAEMRARMPAAVASSPEQWGPWLYYQHIPEGKEYPVLCRRLRYLDGVAKVLPSYLHGFLGEETLLDWNEIAEQFGYVHIGTCRISPDHMFLAYTLDTSGREVFSLQVKDLRTRATVLSTKDKNVVSLAWARDSDCLLFTVCDNTQRPNQVFCRKLGLHETDDLVFTENDGNCCVDVASTKDCKYITINSNSKTSSEVYIIDSANIGNGLWLVRKRVAGVQYFLEHHYGFFYVLTNAPSEGIGKPTEGYYLARCRAEKSLLDKWQALILPGQGYTFHDMDVFHGNLVLFLQKMGQPLFCSIEMPIDGTSEGARKVEDLNPWFFPVPDNLCSILPGLNHDFMSCIYRVVISSPVMPDLIVDYDMKKQAFTVLHQEKVVGLTENEDMDAHSQDLRSSFLNTQNQCLCNVEDSQNWCDLSDTYFCQRREVKSHDGALVPLTILYSRKGQHDRESPGILHGYGAYGENLDKSWCSDRLSLLARGWVLAYADVRGGEGEISWHQAGTKANKLNSIYDFAACAMYLVEEGFVHKNQLAAIGCSAGGFLVGAAINLHPDLFSAAVLKVPFLDICNTLLDPSLPLTTLDYEEFGDPRIRDEFEAIYNYSPYERLSPGTCYPSMLVTASFHDSRVGVWEAAKWVAKVRETTCPSCSRSVILRTNMRSGHFGEGGRFIHCEDTAFEYAFLMKAMGIINDSATSR